MSWYSVRLLIKFVGPGQPKRPLWEDRLVLVRARNHDRARTKALEIAKRNLAPYKNALGQVVRRQPRVYESVQLFDKQLKDGSEVYWRFLSSTDARRKLRKEGIFEGAR